MKSHVRENIVKMRLRDCMNIKLNTDGSKSITFNDFGLGLISKMSNGKLKFDDWTLNKDNTFDVLCNTINQRVSGVSITECILKALDIFNSGSVSDE